MRGAHLTRRESRGAVRSDEWPELCTSVSLVFGLCFRLERALAAPVPPHQRLFALLSAQQDRSGEERAVKRGAIIAGKLDQSGFCYKTAKLD